MLSLKSTLGIFENSKHPLLGRLDMASLSQMLASCLNLVGRQGLSLAGNCVSGRQLKHTGIESENQKKVAKVGFMKNKT